MYGKSILGIAVLQHLTRVTKNLDIGAEILYQSNPMMPGGHIGITSFVGRYRGKIIQRKQRYTFKFNCRS